MPKLREKKMLKVAALIVLTVCLGFVSHDQFLYLYDLRYSPIR